jgi:hypothetical protein
MAFSIPQMQQRFERQFEATDHGVYLYRCYCKGAAIPVTPGERDAFTEQYTVRLYVILSVMVLTPMILLGALVMRTGTRSMGQVPPGQIFAGMVAISIVATGWMEWVFRAPARELRGRAPIGQARSKDEMRAIYFKNISYGKILAIALLGLSAPLARRNLWPENVAWHRWSWAIAIVVVLGATIVAVRKWRFESAHPDDSHA